MAAGLAEASLGVSQAGARMAAAGVEAGVGLAGVGMAATATATEREKRVSRCRLRRPRRPPSLNSRRRPPQTLPPMTQSTP